MESESREDARRRQRSDLRSAAVFVAFFLAVIALVAAIEPVLRWLSTRGDDAVVFANFGEISGAVLFITAFAVISLVWALNTPSTTRAGIGVAIVLAVASAAGWGFVYRNFVAIGVHGTDVVLSFVWPRPRRVIDARTITQAEVVHAVGAETSDVHLYTLEITATGRSWESQPTVHRAELDRALGMLDRARSR